MDNKDLKPYTSDFIKSLYHPRAESQMFHEETHQTYKGLELTVTRSSPYPFEMPREHRPSDYFDKRETTISFIENDNTIKIQISGKGREEVMRVLVNGVPLEFDGQELVFNMNRTFNQEDIQLLLDSLEIEPQKTFRITPFFKLYNGSDQITKTKSDLAAFFELQLNDIIRINGFKTIVTPISSSLTPEQSAHHWYVVALSLDEDNMPQVSFINSTNELNHRKLDEIINDYYTQVVEPLNDALLKLRIPAISIESLQYAQGKQYGNMGCGITATLNIERLLHNNSFHYYTAHDSSAVRTEEMIYRYNAQEIHRYLMTDQVLENIKIEYPSKNAENLARCGGFISLQEWEEEKELLQECNIPFIIRPALVASLPLSHPESVPDNIVNEALQRFELGRKIEQKMQRRASTLQAIIDNVLENIPQQQNNDQRINFEAQQAVENKRTVTDAIKRNPRIGS
jgi:hypothetical protein